jgi:anaerobic selenocysteine-containing dehydrogenase
MGVLPRRMPLLTAVARFEPKGARFAPYLAALGMTLQRKRHWAPYAASITYRTLGPNLPRGAAAAAFLLPLALQFAARHEGAVRRAGHPGSARSLGTSLFEAILEQRSGVVISRHEYDEVWSLLRHADRKVHLKIPEMLADLRGLASETPHGAGEAYPFVLMAGERRSYNANQIFRDPAWRKVDKDGALRMHPADAATAGLVEGGRAQVRSAGGELEVTVEFDEGMRRGVVSLPHGYGARFGDRGPLGPAINRLTRATDCDPFTRTPYHKHVPVAVVAVATAARDATAAA